MIIQRNSKKCVFMCLIISRSQISQKIKHPHQLPTAIFWCCQQQIILSLLCWGTGCSENRDIPGCVFLLWGFAGLRTGCAVLCCAVLTQEAVLWIQISGDKRAPYWQKDTQFKLWWHLTIRLMSSGTGGNTYCLLSANQIKTRATFQTKLLPKAHGKNGSVGRTIDW